MSLKIFHICFIALSTLLCIGSAIWAFAAANPIVALACAALAIALPIYGVSFWKKMRHVIL